MDKLYVTFEVSVWDTEYKYQSEHKGRAKVTIQVPRIILDSIDPGNLFLGALQAALVEFDTPVVEEKEV